MRVSEVVRDALRRQVRVERLAELQRYGRERAESMGIGPEDSGDPDDDLPQALLAELRGR
jgi:hypothetical protein